MTGGNHGTIFGASWVDGKYGKGLLFNGVDSSVTILDGVGLDGLAAFSFGLFFKGTRVAWVNDSLLRKEGVYSVYIDAGGTMYIAFYNEAGASAVASSSGWNVNQWYHLAVTYDGAITKIYRDSVEVYSGITVTGTLKNNTNALLLGIAAGGIQPFQGIEDEVRFHNRDLTPTEINAAMRNQAPRNGLVGEWLLNEGTGAIAYDSSWGFGDAFNAVFDAAATVFGAVTGIKKTIDSMLALGPDFPQVLITPDPAPSEPGAVASVLDVTVNFSVAVLVQVVEPKNWRREIVPVMGLVSDAVLSNASLNGSVQNCYQTLFAPGELTFKNHIFYGGVIKFSARLRYQKS